MITIYTTGGEALSKRLLDGYQLHPVGPTRSARSSRTRGVAALLVEFYARTAQEATEVLEEAAVGTLEITSLAEESRPPAHASDEAH